MSIVVSDASPVHYLILIGAVYVLPDLFSKVFIPEYIVAEELQNAKTPRLVRDWIIRLPSWVEVRNPSCPVALGLQRGEEHAISLALESNAPVLLDEREARQVAEQKGLLVVGTVGIIDHAVEEIRAEVGGERVILGLSGGVDSSVAAALLHKAIGNQLTCIFVNNGLLRGREAQVVREVFGRHFKIKLQYEDASKLFLRRLKGVTDPERKRKIIGKTFIEVFEAATRRAGAAKFLGQGTLYPDVIESVPIAGNPAAMIKSHHNVGGLPKKMKFRLIEPLKCLFKDEVRQLGSELGLPNEMVMRQPFPGPGLAVRILGEVTPRRCDILREADTIVVEEMKASGWYYKIWQSFAVLLPVRSVGVMGDERTYEFTIAIRAVESQDGMTADWVKLPYELLEKLSNRIINEVKGVNRVCFDISSKPPATIEWE